MPGKTLEFHPAALEELKSALSWYRERSVIAANRLAAEIDRCIALVSASPQRWPLRADGTRRFILSHFPFAVVYRETETTIQILAFAHRYRRPGYWRNRV
ncbi:type II toxin-antitoxin system RelE/ParE family toxin [Paracidobacterium acidisoli]|uniref:Type II toxin-antitoxin system RelE/ParE family toxin n=1 Tax=Paracidobacterium acidisoli TaxID=2303751 RepID=A0A372IJQ2_9BACT|nr:type II toxin-antitoxin system RelE/ParE family toxin [Paracidobacterium acidisoli]